MLSLLLALSTLKTQGAYDEVRALPDGQTLLMRTVDWPVGEDESARVIVHWLLQDDGGLRYEFDRQPAATQDVHRRACANNGLAPATNIIVSGEGASHGFGCGTTASPPPD